MKKLIFFLFGTGAFASCFAGLRLPAIIGDSMVLQRSTLVPLWGWATPGQHITVTAGWPGARATSTTAGKDGRWTVKIKTPGAGGPYSITISGGETIALKGVLIGEVWLCSGQSNMEMPLSGWDGAPIKNSSAEIAAAAHPSIHLFLVRNATAFRPQDTLTGHWSACYSSSVKDFSAAAYFFAREINKRLNVPVGVIDATWGGTVAEAWTSNESLKTIGDFDSAIRRVDTMSMDEAKNKITDSLSDLAFHAKLAVGDSSYALPSTGTGNWKTMIVPNSWEEAGLPGFDGIVWFRKTVTVPPSWAGKTLTLALGSVDDFDQTWCNGVPVGNTQTPNTRRTYLIPAAVVTGGPLTIAVRVTDVGGDGGISGEAKDMKLFPAAAGAGDTIALAGDWNYKVEAEKPRPLADYQPNQPSLLFNAMIFPLIPYSLRGALWYQGESNIGRASQYAKLFPLMISDWRSLWKEGDFPFYFVQIAPYDYNGDSTEAAALRDAQRRTLGASPQTGMVVTLDIGELKNIHPANKQEVGRRLSLWALAKTYGQAGVSFCGPLYASMKPVPGGAVVRFTHTEGGLKTSGRTLSGFELCGADGVWKPAGAVISGNQVSVSSPGVPQPVGVRYGWSDIFEASLFNGAGLPASSFSTEALRD